MLTRFSTGSSTAVCVDSGEVSVIPQPIVTCSMCIRDRTCLITSTGHGRAGHDPGAQAAEVESVEVGLGSSAMNIVGTP